MLTMNFYGIVKNLPDACGMERLSKVIDAKRQPD